MRHMSEVPHVNVPLLAASLATVLWFSHCHCPLYLDILHTKLTDLFYLPILHLVHDPIRLQVHRNGAGVGRVVVTQLVPASQLLCSFPIPHLSRRGTSLVDSAIGSAATSSES